MKTTIAQEAKFVRGKCIGFMSNGKELIIVGSEDAIMAFMEQDGFRKSGESPKPCMLTITKEEIR